MIKIVTAIYDSKCEAYSAPSLFKTRGEAMRAWIEAVKDEKSPMFKHPEDYTMFEIGTYDEEKGVFNNSKAPYSYGTAHTLVN